MSGTTPIHTSRVGGFAEFLGNLGHRRPVVGPAPASR